MSEISMNSKKGKNFKEVIKQEKNKGKAFKKVMYMLSSIDSSLVYGGSFLFSLLS
jgi:mRNA-degrading endonuclease YafQ of YafQ-DinJ toxin-antitoxin module